MGGSTVNLLVPYPDDRGLSELVEDEESGTRNDFIVAFASVSYSQKAYPYILTKNFI